MNLSDKFGAEEWALLSTIHGGDEARDAKLAEFTNDEDAYAYADVYADVALRKYWLDRGQASEWDGEGEQILEEAETLTEAERAYVDQTGGY